MMNGHEDAVAARDKIQALEEENRKLKIVCRYQYLTLGFYSTPYNYRQKIGYPDGSWKTNIMEDEGHDARVAGILTRRYFPEETTAKDPWPGPEDDKMKGCWEEAKVYGQELCDRHNLGKL